MAATQSQPEQQKLSQNQQSLLLAALNSQRQDRQISPSQANMNVADQSELFISPQNAELDSFNDFTPDLDYLDGDASFDFDNADLGGEMIGALPGSGEDSDEGKHELHDKRKSPDENEEAEFGDAKRQETHDQKGNKKPGRKPLTSEPTTKRKAQNRAAQRAFRERKEQHLKDLETKVTELTKSSEADKHEKGLLKAQVERLQVELKEYRKRLSLNGTASRSPPTTASNGRSNSNQFSFDFPKFGGLPGSQMFPNQTYGDTRNSATPPTNSNSPASNTNYSQNGANTSRHNSAAQSLSPASGLGNGSNVGSPDAFPSVGYSTNNNMHGFGKTLPQMNNDPFGDLFSPSILKSAGGNNTNYFANGQNANANNASTDNGGDSTAGLSRVFQFNSGSSASDSASPSTSSGSQWNANTGNSSCGTTPEPSHGSPDNKKTAEVTPQTFTSPQNVDNSIFNTDYTLPSSNTFDPVLFGDYRENQDSIIGNGTDFTGGFFDEALNSAPFDYTSPSNLFGILQSPPSTNASLPNTNSGAANTPAPSRNLMAEVEKARDGGDDDYGLTPNLVEQQKQYDGKLISCNNIWNQLQSNPEFQDGKFDLDGLCSELRAKARCSESGVLVDQNHVDAAFKKLGKKKEDGTDVPMPRLMFEQDSWDQVMKKMGGNSQV